MLGISILVDPSSATAVLFQRIGCRAVFPKLNNSRFRVYIGRRREERDQQWAFYFQGTFEVIYYAQ